MTLQLLRGERIDQSYYCPSMKPTRSMIRCMCVPLRQQWPPVRMNCSTEHCSGRGRSTPSRRAYQSVRRWSSCDFDQLRPPACACGREWVSEQYIYVYMYVCIYAHVCMFTLQDDDGGVCARYVNSPSLLRLQRCSQCSGCYCSPPNI